MALTRTIVFNGTDISALPNITIMDIAKDDLPNRNVTDYTLARTDGRKQIAAFYDNRQIVVTGAIIATDVPTFESNRASLFQILDGQDLPIDLIVNTVQQRFYGTVASLIFSESSGGFGVFTLTFECSSPFGIDPNLLPGLASTAISAQPSTQNLASIQGTYKCSPKLSVYITSGTGINAVTNFVKLTNVVTGKYIQITRAFAVGELLVIDVYNKTVTVNNLAVDYSGNLDLFWAIGAGGQIKYEDNFTTRSIKLTFDYYPRYL
jgi:phage-related protein